MPPDRRSSDFERFVTAATPSLLRTAYLLTWNLPEAEDLLQEAFVRTAKRWPRVRKMEHPVAYTRRVLVNASLDAAKQRSRRSIELDGVGSSIDGHPDAGAEAELLAIDTRSELLFMLSTLPRRQRAVLVLRYFEDLSEREIADQLGWPVGTVKSTAARALDRLQQTFSEARTSVGGLAGEPIDVPRSAS